MADMLGTKSFAELGIKLLQASKVPILPDTRDRILTIPGRHGVYDFGAELGPRQFDLECILVTDTPADLQQTIRNLSAHLMDETGRPRLHQLRFDIEPDKYYNVRYAGSLPVDRLVGFGSFTLPLVAYDPFAFGDEVQVNFVNDAATVTNPGTMRAYPTFEVTFTAPASEWKVSIGTGEYVRVVRDFAVGETLTVNFPNQAVIINTTANMSYLDWENSEFFALPLGASTLNVTPTGVCDTIIKFSPRWL